MITAYELKEFEKVCVKDVTIEMLYDVKEIKIEESYSCYERMEMLLRYGNPYIHRDDTIKVKSSFTEDGSTLWEQLETILNTV